MTTATSMRPSRLLLTALTGESIFRRLSTCRVADCACVALSWWWVACSALARQLAAEATVLLKNAAGTLPLSTTALAGKTVAVIGDENTVAGSGSGGVIGYEVSTPSAAVTARLAGTGVRVSNASYWSPVCGANQCQNQTPGVSQLNINRAVSAARQAGANKTERERERGGGGGGGGCG
eukprot:COSAG03_NODE_6575_length_1038_cov_2.219382_2_plen_178_part_01